MLKTIETPSVRINGIESTVSFGSDTDWMATYNVPDYRAKVSTIAGSVGNRGSLDGTGTEANFDNPYFITSKQVFTHLQKSDLDDIRDQISQVFFYGAGCSSSKMNKIIETPFCDFFKNAEVNIHHDLDAACYSMYDGESAITGILGTGSNSCMFDGTTIFESAPSLGFMLGDEASGNYFGKKLINLY